MTQTTQSKRPTWADSIPLLHLGSETSASPEVAGAMWPLDFLPEFHLYQVLVASRDHIPLGMNWPFVSANFRGYLGTQSARSAKVCGSCAISLCWNVARPSLKLKTYDLRNEGRAWRETALCVLGGRKEKQYTFDKKTIKRSICDPLMPWTRTKDLPQKAAQKSQDRG